MIATAAIASRSTAVYVASDGRWSALFLANFHFASVNPNVLINRESPIAAYWSLAIEEQFYLLYPAFFAGLLLIPGRWTTRTRLRIGLVGIVAISLAVSITTSHQGQLGAYFALSTRAWELAIGGLVAVFTRELRNLPTMMAAGMTWIGLVAIVYSGLTLSVAYSYPGYVATLPVVGAAMVIAGGSKAPRWGAEALLGSRPFGWIGRRSYAWYLWHTSVFALVVLGSGQAFASHSWAERMGWALGSLALAAVSYLLMRETLRAIQPG